MIEIDDKVFLVLLGTILFLFLLAISSCDWVNSKGMCSQVALCVKACEEKGCETQSIIFNQKYVRHCQCQCEPETLPWEK